MDVDSLPMGLVVLPLAFVDVPIGVDESTPTVGLVLHPVALVQGIVFPNLLSPTVPHSIFELANIGCLVFEPDGALGDVLAGGVIAVFEWAHAHGHFPRGLVIEVGGLEVIALRGFQDQLVGLLVLRRSAVLAGSSHLR